MLQLHHSVVGVDAKQELKPYEAFYKDLFFYVSHKRHNTDNNGQDAVHLIFRWLQTTIPIYHNLQSCNQT